MTSSTAASSPYAPTARNLFLQHHHDGRQQSLSFHKRLYRRTAFIAVLLLVIRFWRHLSPAFFQQTKQAVLEMWSNPSRCCCCCRRRLTNSAGGQAVAHHGRLLCKAVSAVMESIVQRLEALLATRAPPSVPATSSVREVVQQDEERFVGRMVYRMAQSVVERLQGYASWPAANPALQEANDEESESLQGGEFVTPDSDSTPLDSYSRRAVVRRNQQLIQSILHYWFGQYAPETCQKKLWMIASSSGKHRNAVDAEIADNFLDVLVQLASRQGEGGAEACTMWKEWCHDVELYGYAGKIAAIVALDQFSRHVIRHLTTRATSNSSDAVDKAVDAAKTAMPPVVLPPQAELDAIAYETAQLFVQQHARDIECGMVPLPMYIFGLMPYRHANTIASVHYVQECIHKMANVHGQMDAMIGRFRKATNRRMAVLQDEARRTAAAVGTDDGAVVGRNGQGPPQVDVGDEDILQVFPFDADMRLARNHIVCKTVVAFLTNRGIGPRQGNKSGASVIVSLSGGVDSMVIASVLAYLRDECSYDIRIVAIHIDYANRPESGAEAMYVRRYCEKLQIRYKCRTIDEVTRGETARDDYERIAREARYNMYSETVNECMNGDSNVEIAVMLGHHRGDLRENVLSNSHKGCGPLDLSGMTAVSKNDGVVIYRPLLPLEKKYIYDYAHSFGVPYFKDTTPRWSTRGKLRNKLLPLLEEIYGEGSMNNLSTLAIESDEARELLNKAVLAPFLDQVDHKPMGITFATRPWREQGLFFWKFVLREALHSAGLGMFSEKSVIAFLERVQADTLRPGWLQCRRDYAVYLQNDGRIFVFFPESFPFRKADQYDCIGKAVACGKENAVSIGPWTVYSEVVSEGEESLLEQKAVSSMDDLFSGCLSYFLKSPVVYENSKVLPKPLIFIKEFTRHTRPRSWKQIDLKIQSTLPLLGNDETAVEELADGALRLMVKVSLILGAKRS